MLFCCTVVDRLLPFYYYTIYDWISEMLLEIYMPFPCDMALGFTIHMLGCACEAGKLMFFYYCERKASLNSDIYSGRM